MRVHVIDLLFVLSQALENLIDVFFIYRMLNLIKSYNPFALLI